MSTVTMHGTSAFRVGDCIQISGGKKMRVLSVTPTQMQVAYWHWWDRAWLYLYRDWQYTKFIWDNRWIAFTCLFDKDCRG